MLMKNLILQTLSIVSIPKKVFDDNVLRMFNYSFPQAHHNTICYIPSLGKELLSGIWMQGLVAVKVIGPGRDTAEFCTGYVITVKDDSDFSGVLVNFLPHRTVLVFSADTFRVTSAIRQRLYSKALSIVVTHGLVQQELRPEVFFVIENKVISFVKEVSTKDFPTTNKWSPKLLKEIRVSLFHCPPFVMVRGKRLEGVEFNIFKMVAKDWPVKLNIEKEDKVMRENLHRKIIQKLVDNQTDIAMCGLWQRVIMEKNLDSSSYSAEQCISFLAARSTLLADETFIFQPFSDGLWLLMLVVVVLMYVVRALLQNTGNENNRLSALLIISHLSLGPSFPKSARPAVNTLFQFWALFCLITLTYYSAGLTRSLQFPRFSKEINTFEDMAKYQVRWEEPISSLQQWLHETNHSLYQEIARLFTVENNQDVINKHLRSGNYALLVKVVNNQYVCNEEYLDGFGRENLKLIHGCLGDFYTVIGFQRQSPFTEIFNKEVPKFQEHGFVSHWEKVYSTTEEVRHMKNFFEKSEARVSQLIDFSKLKGAFLLLILGYVSGTVALVFEIIVCGRAKI